ncbi:MAG: tetratricopeptide repeat protein [Pirellulales bacterium]|nr:tetratricopeptide repeat protein [Pirellulales bacterium]
MNRSLLTSAVLLTGFLVLLGDWLPALRAEAPAPAADPTDSRPPAELSRPLATEKPVSEVVTDAAGNPLEPLDPKQVATEADRDHLEALSLFAAARTKQQREDLPGALRLYQRALRFDPASEMILQQIVTLATELERMGEAIRYAVKAADVTPEGPVVLLRALALHLAEQGQPERAIALYERALASPDLDRESPAYILLTSELAQLYMAHDQADKAAESFRLVQERIEAQGGGAGEERVRAVVLEGLGGQQGAYLSFGDAYFAANRLEEATAAFRAADAAKHDEALLGYNLARVAFAQANPDKALEELGKYLHAKSDSAGIAAYELLANILERQGAKGALVERLEALQTDDPKNVPLAYYLAERYREAGQFDKVAALLRPLVSERPTVEILQALARADRELKQFSGLVDTLAVCSGEGRSLDVLGEELDAILGDAAVIDGLIAALRQRMADEPDKLPAGAHLAVALLALEAGRLDVGQEFFTLALGPRSPQEQGELLIDWGVALLSAEHPAAAAEHLRRAADVLPKEAPQSILARYYLAGALELAGQTDEALAVAREATSAGEKNARFAPLLQSRLAWVLYHAKRFDAAESEYRKLIALFDQDYTIEETREVLRDTRLILSNLRVLHDDLPAAEEWLEQVLDEFPDDISAQNDLGYLWADQGKRLSHALAMVQAAVKAEPDNGAYRDSLGWTLHRLGRDEEALAELRQAVAGDDPDGVILDHLGDVLLALGQVAEAREAWTRAVAAFDPAVESKQIEATQQKLAAHPVDAAPQN